MKSCWSIFVGGEADEVDEAVVKRDCATECRMVIMSPDSMAGGLIMVMLRQYVKED